MRWLVLFTVLAAASPAFARSEKTLDYPRARAWPTAVRFLRVDEGLKIIEKDADDGYVLFELHEDKRTFRGSLEVIDVRHDGQPAVRFVLQIADRPAWVEVEMLDKLARKLRAELGAPAPPPAPEPPPKPAPPAKDGPAQDGSAGLAPPPISATP
jgi:hypothetical protein